MPRPSQEPPQRSSRQAQGLACEECRARKLRCDRVRPTCGTCESLGVSCTPNTARQPRGPRKGHLKALQSRISALERRLGGESIDAEGSPSPGHHRQNSVQSEQSPGQQSEAASDGFQEQAGVEEPYSWQPPSGIPNGFSDHAGTGEISGLQPPNEQLNIQSTTVLERLSLLQGLPPVTCDFPFPPTASTTPSILDQSHTAGNLMDIPDYPFSVPIDFDARVFIPSKPSTSGSLSSVQSELPSRFSSASAFHLPELMKADLNHLYFDRVHSFAPILNRRRYFARAAHPVGAAAPFVSLQHAMWTLAACLGSGFKDIQKSLYSHTRALLEEWEQTIITEPPPIELAQAWIFLAIYEIMQVNYDRGWLSAGRCFRLVQLMKLHEIDVPNGIAESTSLTFVEIEERRRTFWMAYSLDRFINLINQLPLTLSEQVILTRLPTAEAAFQRERPIKTPFLSEVISGNSDFQQVSSFNACIILVTISGRCLSHHQQCVVERAYGNMLQDFLARHQWLESLLSDKIKNLLALSSSCDVDDEPTDPMLLFTHMAAHATTLLLGKAIQSVPWNYQDLASSYEKRVLEAAQNISQLSQKLAEFGYFKMHPFTPIPLFFCAEFAQGRKTLDATFQALYDSMTSSLRDLSAVNMLAQTCLNLSLTN
ncbi:hypothetical protein GQ43DRAFT_453446 [Delitschia confertaspora ATCC 74209]|uniref:Zn(2)-C6 fungal-type domain-containing protein n=1 Tax=Delitschia confertaspora ATCC 74209 TaxID=1513339 RepID=A0A9P4N2M8_9PLEO|nr:hypothetical protein GQ43DRAFT_453446 [Delitschia confertaspora ATCC 74209]